MRNILFMGLKLFLAIAGGSSSGIDKSDSSPMQVLACFPLTSFIVYFIALFCVLFSLLSRVADLTFQIVRIQIWLLIFVFVLTSYNTTFLFKFSKSEANYQAQGTDPKPDPFPCGWIRIRQKRPDPPVSEYVSLLLSCLLCIVMAPF
jgi:hypothetical protein